MPGTSTLDTQRLQRLHQFFAAATHDASAAMCRWTNGLITLTLDEVRALPLDELTTALGLGTERLTMVVLTLDGPLGGTMLLTFDDQNGRQLAASLLCRPASSGDAWSDFEKSALSETGNILSCAYMNALTRLIHAELVPSPPLFLQDYGASVLEQAVLQQLGDGDEVMVCRTRFQRQGTALDWNVVFVPSLELRTALLAAL